MTDEEYRVEYPDASDADIEMIRWALHDEKQTPDTDVDPDKKEKT